MKIKSWEKFQHYKDRNPPWIKLYRDLLNDREWFALDGDTAKVLINLWLIAAEDEGELPSVPDLAFRLRATEKQINVALSKLSHWLEQDASGLLAERKQVATPETETETETETEAETERDARERALADQFKIFWDVYPHKVGKPAASKSFLRQRCNGADFGAILDGLNRYIAAKPPDRQWLNPATFLNQRRWEDQPATGVQSGTNRQERHSLRAAFDRLDSALDRQAETGNVSFPPNLRLLSGGSV